MIAFSISEILFSIFGSFLLGIFMYIIYELGFSFFYVLHFLFSVKWQTFIYQKKKSIKKFAKIVKDTYFKKSWRWVDFYQFLFTLFFGLVYIVMQFVLCDGVFRVYFFLIAIFSFFAFRKIYKRFLLGLSNLFVSYFCAFFIFIISCIFLPACLLFNKLFKNNKRSVKKANEGGEAFD